MTLKILLEFFEKYYGEKYSGVFLDAMTGYLADRSQAFYKAVAEVMIKRFSRIYNKVPGPAEIEQHLDEILASIPEPQYLPDTQGVSEEQRDTNLKGLEELLIRLGDKNRTRSTETVLREAELEVPIW